MATGFVDRGKGKAMIGMNLYSVQANITAHAGGLPASAVPLTAQNCFISTVATAGDSVRLPPAQAGMEITVINQTATAPNVFANGTDTINASFGASGGAPIAANGTWLITGTTITMSVSNPGYVVAGMSVFDLTIAGGGLLIGTVVSYIGTTLTISAAAHASQGAADSLLFGGVVAVPASSVLIFYAATNGAWWSH